MIALNQAYGSLPGDGVGGQEQTDTNTSILKTPVSRGTNKSKKSVGSSVNQELPLQCPECVAVTNQMALMVVRGDISTQDVEAVVSPANSRLNQCDEIAKAISKKAGPDLQEACNNFTGGERKIPVTGIFVSTGGNLAAKYVIHAVGPKWSEYEESKKEECARDLRRTVLRCLFQANKLGCRSIAIPPISSGE